MSMPTRRRWRWARRALGYGALLALISAALLVGLLNQVLPLVAQHPDEVAEWLTRRVGQPVAFQAVQAKWTRRGPLLRFEDLRVGRDDRQLAVGEAELLVSVYAGLLPGQPLTELRLRGLDLGLMQAEGGAWRIEGLPAAVRPDVDPLDVLQGFGELQVSAARLKILGRAPALTLDLPRADLRLRVDGARLRAGVRVWRHLDMPPLDAVLRWERIPATGQLWIGGRSLRLGVWRGLLTPLGVEAESRDGEVDAWLELGRDGLRRVTVALKADQLRLRRGGDAQPPWTPAHLELLARLTLAPDGWQLSVPRARVGKSGAEQVLDAVWIAHHAGGFAATADRVDTGPLLAALAASGYAPAGASAWLAESAPQGRVQELDVQGRDARRWRARGRFHDVGFSAVGRRPGLRGLSGRIEADANGGRLVLASSPWRVDLPENPAGGFAVDARGSLLWWREAQGWTLASEALALSSEGLVLSGRFALQFQPDGSRPRLDLAARLPTFDVATARHWWRYLPMPPATRRWLDAALLDGRVEQGRLLVAGDLDDWPFRQGRGRFDARASVRDARLKFHPNWPEAQSFNTDVEFFGPGMRLQAEARVQDVPVRLVEGSIEDFKAPRLALNLEGGGDAAALRRLLINSPLYAGLKPTLDAIQIEGPAKAAVQLALPLRPDMGAREVDGRVALQRVRASERRWDVVLDRLQGELAFNATGLRAEQLALEFDGQPGTLAVAAGSDAPAGLAALLSLETEQPIEALLRRAPTVSWLGDYLGGRSMWSLQLALPKAVSGSASPARLRLRSDLVGTRLQLPAPLRKNTATPWPLQLDLPLPIDAGELRLSLGQLMHLRGRSRPYQPFAAQLNFGEPDNESPLPAQGIVARGRTSSLDVAGWIATATSASGTGAGGLRSVSLDVGALDVLDRSFGEVRLGLERDAGNTLVRVDGPAIAGEVTVAAGAGSPVVGRFQRLYWPPVDRRSLAGAVAAPEPDESNPAAVPPLQFRVGDLRVGEARLGSADFASFPTPEGMHIDRFQTRSRELEVEASGDWSRIGDRSRSRFAMTFKARSLGQMLDALGFAGMVEDGPVTATLTGDWPGAPGSFRLDRFDGRMNLDVGKGRLLDVEPGTGRLLGLISIAEVPRRLTLDFSDFFAKGFAFNTLRGDFDFREGIATTSNLNINGPAAEIRVSGQTALGAQQYDQRIEVLPKAGGVLPALGFATAGPAGAAIGAVAQAVLQAPLKQATRTVYRVEGPWAEPRIEVLERGPARPPADPEAVAQPEADAAP